MAGEAITGVCDFAGRDIARLDRRRSAACRATNGCTAETGCVRVVSGEGEIARSTRAVIEGNAPLAEPRITGRSV
jgi:hypothetical protein